MWQLSYWLFPLIFVLFLVWPAAQGFLLPGLLSACVAGAANSAVVENYPSAVGHAAAAAVLAYLAGCAEQRRTSRAARCTSFAVWTVAACLGAWSIPDNAWPYELSRAQMLGVFVPFLLLGEALA